MQYCQRCGRGLFDSMTNQKLGFEILCCECYDLLQKKSEGKRILCLDFDGVVHKFDHDFVSLSHIGGGPVEGVKEFILSLSESYLVMVFGGRSAVDSGRRAMKSWMEQNGLPLVEFPPRKPAASIIIDDCSIPFRGVFPTIQEVNDFKSWIGEKCV